MNGIELVVTHGAEDENSWRLKPLRTFLLAVLPQQDFILRPR